MLEIDAARRYYDDLDSAHGFDHVLRVWQLAKRIGVDEGADMGIVQAAVLLHDVGRSEQERSGACHAEEGARRAREILSGHPTDRVERVAQAIAEHRFRNQHPPTTLEARVLYDADKLDAIGAIGVARAFAMAGAQSQHLWADVPLAYANRPHHDVGGDEKDHTPVHEYVFKLADLKDGLYTATARRIASDRQDYIAGFFRRLSAEVRGQA